MTAEKLLVLFIFTFFTQLSSCLCAVEESEYEAARAFSLSIKLDELRLEIRNAVKEDEIRQLEDILGRFKAVEAPDSEWEAFATTHHCVRWSSRQSWQDTVNSHILVMESIEPVYWSLIAQNTRELTETSAEVDWVGTFNAAIYTVLSTHPVTCKRITMYLLAMVANRYQSPIAQLMTANYLKILNEEGKEPQKILKILRLNFPQLAPWRMFLDALPTTEINKEDLAQHFIKLGKALDPSLEFAVIYDEDKVNHAIGHYIAAGKMGDYEGYLRAALLQKSSMRKNGANNKGVKKMLTNLKLSLILGNPDSSEEFREHTLKTCPKDMQTELLEDWESYEAKLTSTRPGLYKEVKKLLTAK